MLLAMALYAERRCPVEHQLVKALELYFHHSLGPVLSKEMHSPNKSLTKPLDIGHVNARKHAEILRRMNIINGPSAHPHPFTTRCGCPLISVTNFLAHVVSLKSSQTLPNFDGVGAHEHFTNFFAASGRGRSTQTWNP